VDVLEAACVDVSLAHAVEEEFGALEESSAVAADGRYLCRRRGRRFRRRRRLYDPVPGRVSLRGDDGTESFDGLIAYASRSALIDFLLARWAPVGSSALDERLREIQRGRTTVAQRRVALEAFVDKGDTCGPGPALPLVEADNLDLENHGWVRLDRPGHAYYCRSRSEALAVAIERTLAVGDLTVPYCEWLIVGSGHNSQVIHVDRGVTRRYSAYDRLPDAVYRRFDEHGTACSSSARGRVPMAELWPRFVLRVPDHMECNDVVADVDESLPPCFLVEPGLLSDPTRLSTDLPVIDDPAAVRAVLSRTVGGTYLPQNPPVAHVEPPGASLLVGALPTPEVTA